MLSQDQSNKIKVVLFDADGVLFDVTGIHEGIVKELLITLNLNEQLDATNVHKEWDLEDEKIQSESSCPTTYMSPAETLTLSLIKVFERWNISISGTRAKEIAKLNFERFCTQSRVFPEVKEVLPILRKKYELGIISNMPVGVTLRKLENAEIKAFFGHIIGPDTFHAYKPAQRIFRQALTLFAIKPDEVIIIGDNPRTDILGGVNAGIITILIDRKNKYPRDLNPLPDYRITSLSELSELLSSM